MIRIALRFVCDSSVSQFFFFQVSSESLLSCLEFLAFSALKSLITRINLLFLELYVRWRRVEFRANTNWEWETIRSGWELLLENSRISYSALITRNNKSSVLIRNNYVIVKNQWFRRVSFRLEITMDYRLFWYFRELLISLSVSWETLCKK